MSEIIEGARQDFERSRERMLALLTNTPDERLNWSPSPTARTPLALVVHSAMSLYHITEMLQGRPFGADSTAAADHDFREEERAITLRQEAVDLFEKNAAAFLKWIGALEESGLDDPITFPFGLGTGCVRHGITAAARHTEAHLAQLEYLQTIYGDQNWHIGV